MTYRTYENIIWGLLLAAVLAITAIFLIGCGPPEDPPAERGVAEVKAREIVWHQEFKSNWPAPTVVWWYGTCPTAQNDPRTAVVIGGVCYSGLTFPDEMKCNVAWRGSFSTSAYTHELMHAWQATRGIYDPQHMLAEWNRVPEIDAELSANGL